MPAPKREGRNDAEWTPEDFIASRNLLRLWKQKAKISQNQLAKRWGISQSALSRYINGVNMLNPETILKFSVVLDVPPETIDPRINQLMRTKKNEYTHSIVVRTDDYAPRIFQGDWISLDVINKPKEGKLVAAHNADSLVIGYYQAGVLLHPIKNEPQTIETGMIVHNISSIIPKECL